jgi:hypothetical protein
MTTATTLRWFAAFEDRGIIIRNSLWFDDGDDMSDWTDVTDSMPRYVHRESLKPTHANPSKLYLFTDEDQDFPRLKAELLLEQRS